MLNPILVGLIKALMLRLTNDLDASRILIKQLIYEAGMLGEFELQTEAIFEQVKIERLQGRYTEGIALIDYLHRTFASYLSSDLIKRIALERIQILLEVDDADIALAKLGSLDDTEALLLKAEANYQLGYYDECTKLCETLMNRPLSNLQLIILHNLLGRCYQYHNLQSAIVYFDLAVQYANIEANLRHLVRSLINLSVVLIANEDVNLALTKLELAEKICTTTQDTVSLRTINHNQAYIRRLLSAQH